MADDGDTAGSDQPGNGREGRGNQANWYRDYQQASVELAGRGFESTDLKVTSVELTDEEHAEGDKDDVEEQPPVRQQGVDAEHNENDAVVAAEVAEVVVDARLNLAKVLRLGKALEVEELGQGPEV